MTKTLETLETQSMNETQPSVAEPFAWTALKTHLLRWFYKPDLEALEVVMSAVATHPLIQGNPCWLFVLGPSGSGKSEIIINSLRDVPGSHVLGAVNENTFISFYRGEIGGLLPQLKATNNAGIFLFKDFTSLLSLRDDERLKIMGQMREIYDGYWSRKSGAGEHLWEGKVTCIAACTPALEDAWSLKRDLGERFLTVRWPRIGSKYLARTAGKQRGHELSIRKTTAALGLQLLQGTKMRTLPTLSTEMNNRIASLSEIVAVLRGNVKRNTGGKREIVGVQEPEEPGRISLILGAVMCAHAGLWGRTDPIDDDYRIARRLALDSIPTRRLTLFRHFPLNKGVSLNELATVTHLSEETIDWNMDELLALRAVDVRVEKDGFQVVATRTFSLSPTFIELVEEAKLTLPF